MALHQNCQYFGVALLQIGQDFILSVNISQALIKQP